MPLLFWLRCAIALLGRLAAVAAAAQPVTLERDSALHAEPRLDSPVVANLTKGTAGEAVAKQGAWVQISRRRARRAGCIPSMCVSRRRSRERRRAAVRCWGGVFGPRQTSMSPAPSACAGSGEEDLSQARFDGGQLKLLDRYAVSEADADEAARRRAGLDAARVDYFDGPSR